ncbi:MAG TPA: hypothetical protein VHE83_15085, partial [Mycobacteriales bacterium]|nr:hypothetical protein [Mycobacteriales bacterium]
MTTPTKRPSRRRPAAPPAEGHRPLRSVGYRVPVVLDDELDDDGATWTAAAPAHPPMWEQQWEEPPAAEPPAGVVPPPLPVVEIGPEVPALADDPDLDAEPDGPRSLYLAALRVRHLQPGVFQRVLLVEGVFALAVILALADLASP